MSDTNVKLVIHNENSQFDSIVHHKQIQQYIDGLDKYIKVISSLQNIYHDMEKSKIKIKTPMGSITCSLIFGSILFNLNDKDMTIMELSNILKINVDEVTKRIKSLIKYNVVIKNTSSYKYTPPYGDVECELLNDNDEDNYREIVTERFTDILMTIESRIIKEVKPNKMNIMELERRIQEFLGESFVRNIFYDRLESLKKRYYVKDVDSIIEYVV
jgi:DNA-binding transcriptional regulator GbsR (MarR family)